MRDVIIIKKIYSKISIEYIIELENNINLHMIKILI